MNTEEVLKKLKGVSLLSDRDEDFNLGFVDSGSFALNKVISGSFNGGYPIGGIVEIMGESSTGKTAFLTHAFANAQKKGYYTGLLDNEFAYNMRFASLLGVDSRKLMYDDPETVPQAFKRAEEWILGIREHDKDTPIILGLDSMAGQSDKEEEKKIGEFDNMDGANRAKEIGQCLRHINPLLRKHKVCLIVINQVRAKPGVMYGDPLTRSGGGKALEFYCAVSLQTLSNKTSDVIKDSNEQPLGIKGRIRNKKNKVAIPFQECEFELIYDKGLTQYYGLADYIVSAGLLEKSGAWYSIKETGVKFQGDDKLMEFITTSDKVKTYLSQN